MKKKLIAIVLLLLITPLVAEVFTRAVYIARKGFSYDIAQLKVDGRFHEFAYTDYQKDCFWLDSFYPHPNLTYVQYDNGRCGFKDSPIKFEENNNFVILLMGGGLARLLHNEGKQLLENELNTFYVAPGNRPFSIKSAALLGWKQPNQLYSIKAYASKIDAYVSIEGLHEATAIQWGRKIEAPPWHYYMIFQSGDYDSSLINIFRERKKNIETYSLLRNSMFVNALFLFFKTRYSNELTEQIRASSTFRSFNYPESWSEEKKLETSFQTYMNYVKDVDAIATQRKIPGIVFLEPLPENPSQHGVKPEGYKELSTRLKELKFARSTYVNLHERVKAEELGQIAKIMAQEISRAWKLKQKKI